jgi:hypothetical protein
VFGRVSHRFVAVALILTVSLGAACGGGGTSAKGNPEDALAEALNRLKDADGLTLTFIVASTTEDMLAVFEGGLNEQQANWILDSSLTLAANRAEDDEDVEAAFGADIAGIEDAVQINVVGTMLYARADIRTMVELFGADVAELDQFEQQATRRGFDFVGPAIDGEWLSLDLDQLQQAAGTSQELADQQQLILDRFVESLRENSGVEFEGEDDIGEHVVATIPLRTAYKNLAELSDELTRGGGEVPPSSEVPDESATVDVWLDNGRVVQIQLDFLQFAEMGDEPVPEGVDEFALQLDIDEGEVDVEAPDEAHEVTVQELTELFFGDFDF